MKIGSNALNGSHSDSKENKENEEKKSIFHLDLDDDGENYVGGKFFLDSKKIFRIYLIIPLKTFS